MSPGTKLFTPVKVTTPLVIENAVMPTDWGPRIVPVLIEMGEQVVKCPSIVRNPYT
jgi:hypothetical protein